MAVIGNAPALGIITGDNILDGSIKAADLAPGAAVPSQTGNAGKYLTTDGTDSSWGALSIVKITGVTYPGDDLAADPAGGQTLTITGSGFTSTPTVYVNDTIAPSVTYVSSTQITITTPAKTAGTYNLYVINPDGSTAIHVMGVSYSGTPTWTTAAGSLGTTDAAVSIQLAATSNSSVTYALTSGSSLPSGITLSSSGLISGTATVEQTFSFSVDAIDAENQQTPRSFSVTVSLADAYFNYVTMLLHGDGTNGAQNNTFLDSSTANSGSGWTVTRNGNVTQGALSPYGSNWSNYFPGSSCLSEPNTTNWNIDTSSTYSGECWVNYTTATNNTILMGSAGRWWFSLGFSPGSVTSGRFGISVYTSGATWQTLSSSTAPVAGVWYHVAFTVSSGALKLYVNGVLEASTTGIVATTSTNTFDIGSYAGAASTYGTTGYISNARVIKGGTLVYTGNFTPPTTPLTATANTVLLTCRSNNFKDTSGSGNAVSLTGTPSIQRFNPFGASTAYSAATYGGSGYFDGTGDYLSIASTSALDFGTGSFTVEAWIYTAVKADYYSIMGSYASVGWYFHTNSSGTITFGVGPSPTNGTKQVCDSAWHHVAIVRNGSTVTLYVDGAVDTSITDATNCTTGVETRIGSLSSGYPRYFLGYIADVRMAKGTAIYTSTFTPPTAPLAAVSGTSLLCSMTNAAIYDNAMMNDLETVGNAQISTSVKKYGTGSMYFDGTGDYLSVATSPQLNMGSSSFTIEGWFYPSGNVSAGKGLFGKRANNGVVGGILFYFSSTGLTPRLLADIGGSWGVDVTASSGFTNAQWNHFAVVRNGSTWTIYINGTSVGSTTNSGTVTTNTAAFTWMAESANASEGTTAGYLDDLRITVGYARYTTTFTPPTAALKDK